MVYRWEKSYCESGLAGLEDKEGKPWKDISKSNKKVKTQHSNK